LSCARRLSLPAYRTVPGPINWSNVKLKFLRIAAARAAEALEVCEALSRVAEESTAVARFAPRNPKPETRNPEPGTRNPEP
jgi:hypothetical protein